MQMQLEKYVDEATKGKYVLGKTKDKKGNKEEEKKSLLAKLQEKLWKKD